MQARSCVLDRAPDNAADRIIKEQMRVSILEIIGDGQLCFFAIALLAVTLNGISHLMPQKQRAEWATRHLRWADPSCCTFIIIIVFVFALIVSENAANTQADKNRLTWASVILTVGALIVIYVWHWNLDRFS